MAAQDAHLQRQVPSQLDEPSLPFRIGSAIVMGLTASLWRSFLVGANTLQVNGLDDFERLLEERKDIHGRTKGLITVSNHLCVYDDPIMWGALPWRWHWSPNHLRWSLASHDLAFQNRFAASFFTLGQTLPTHRLAHSPYGGPFQPMMTQAIRLLSSYPFNSSSSSAERSASPPTTVSSTSTITSALQASSSSDSDPFTGGQLTYTTNGTDLFSAPSAYASRKHAWVHVFPEGRIHQHPEHTMRYFKWGVSRLILEAEPCPDLVPIWIEGFDQIMHESRTFPRPLPRPGKNVVVTFGDKVDTEAAFGDLRRRWRELVEDEKRRLTLCSSSPTTQKRTSWLCRLDRLLVDKADGEMKAASSSSSYERLPYLARANIEDRADTADQLDHLGVLSDRLKYGHEAVDLRKECTMRVREQVLHLRRKRGLPDEDPKARWVDTWREEGRLAKRDGQMRDGSWVGDT